jgi:hypothetical protein
MDKIEKRQRYEIARQELVSERSSFDADYQELADYLAPRRVRFVTSDVNKGGRRDQKIIDSTGRFAVRTLQSGLHAGLTSPARPWVRLAVPDPDLNEFAPVKAWLHTVTQRILDVFLKSNLYNALPILYGDMGVFAIGAMSVVEDPLDLMRCHVYPVGSYAIGLNARGIATTFVRDYQMTVRRLVEQFGPVTPGSKDIDWSRFSTTVKHLWDRGSYEQRVDITWIVTPNVGADPSKFYAHDRMPWHSCFFERGGPQDRFLREGGYEQFPVMVPRWDVTGEDVYGSDSPGYVAIGDVKMLQLMQRNKAKAVAKALDPPLQGPSAMRTTKTSLLPGDLTIVDVREGMAGLRPIHEVRLEGLGVFQADIQETQYRIRRAFYEDLFLMLASSDGSRGAQPITAREIEERHEEKLLALGPVLERTNDELLDPLVDRVFGMMLRAGAIPPAPRELHGMDLKVEYISLMSQAQKLVGVSGQDRFLQSAQALVGLFPEAKHKINVWQAIDDYAVMLGVNPKLVRSNDEAAAGLDAEHQAMQQAHAADQFAKTAQATKALAEAPADGDSVLSRMTDRVAA